MHLAVWILIGSVVLVSYKAFKDQYLFRRYLFHVGAIRQGKQYERMITSAWLHGDTAHLAFNMIALWSFAGGIVRVSSIYFFLITYFISLIGGSLTSLYVHRDHLNYSAVGASGAVSGIVFSSILLFPEGSIYLFLIPFPIPSWLFGIGYLLLSMYGMKRQSDNIGHEAHFGGAISGLIVTTIWFPGIWQRFFQFLF